MTKQSLGSIIIIHIFKGVISLKNKYFIRAVALSIFISLLIPLAGCRRQEKFSKTYIEYFDTVITVTIYGIEKSSCENTEKTIQDELQKYHELFDIYNNYPDTVNLKSVNEYAVDSPLEISEELIEFISYCKNAYLSTDGYLNIAMGNLLTLWKAAQKNAEAGTSVPPSNESLNIASEHMDINDIVLNKEENTVFLADPNISLDAGAVGKGYASEKLAEKLKAEGYRNFILNFGGNIVASGHKESEKLWQVAIEDPSNTKNSICKLSLTDCAVVTSGSYYRYFTYGGTRYHHIINPHTLYPENHFLSVTVICDSSAFADVASTALFSMTLDEGLSFVSSKPNIEVMWVTNDGSIHYSEGFEHYISEVTK